MKTCTYPSHFLWQYRTQGLSMSMLSLGVGRLPLTVCHNYWSSALSAQTDQCQFFQSVGAWPHQIRFLGEAEIACLSRSINQPVSCPLLSCTCSFSRSCPISEASDQLAQYLLSLLTGSVFCKMFKHFLMAYWLASGWLKVSRIGFHREKDVLSLKVQHHNRNTQSHTMLHYTQSRLNISTPFAKGTVPLATHIERNLFPAVMSWKLHFFSLYSLWDCNKKILLPHRSPSLSGILPGPRKCSHGLTNRATAQKNSTHTSTAWLQIPEATALQEMHGCNWHKHMLPTAPDSESSYFLCPSKENEEVDSNLRKANNYWRRRGLLRGTILQAFLISKNCLETSRSTGTILKRHDRRLCKYSPPN